MSIKALAYLIYDSILDIIFPKDSLCITCKENEAEGVCLTCKSLIYKLPIEDESYGIYKGPLKELILNLKFLKDFNSGEVLVDLLEEKIIGAKGYYITYIPSSKKSLKRRGFNQCEYLGNALSRRLDIPCVSTLIKTKETKDQKTLTIRERKNNVKNVFEGKNINLIKGNKFILIDDVITTGATIEEGVRVLKKYGAKEIKILTIAKSHV